METRKFQTGGGDPILDSMEDPAKDSTSPASLLADSDSLNLAFEFGDDPAGAICPLSAHIRKAYPRDEPVHPPTGRDEDSESDTQTHRLLRRGIPFGASFKNAENGSADISRGLVFQCYQSSIERQFEFVQQKWIGAATFPPHGGLPNPGEDPIIAQNPSGTFLMKPTDGEPTDVDHFVTMKGGEYFFTPSLSALRELGDGQH